MGVESVHRRVLGLCDTMIPRVPLPSSKTWAFDIRFPMCIGPRQSEIPATGYGLGTRLWSQPWRSKKERFVNLEIAKFPIPVGEAFPVPLDR